MPNILSTTPGLFPLPDHAKDDLSDLKGHQKHDLISGDESTDIEAIYDDARAEIIDIQTESGLDYIVEGQLRWDDMLAHPLCIHDSVETRGLLRYYDNNNFYREPVVTNRLTPDGDVARELTKATAATDHLQAVLPGPYSLYDLATNEFYSDDAEFLAALGDFLAGELNEFPTVTQVFLLEPSLTTNPPDHDLLEDTTDAIETISTASPTDVIVHSYWAPLTETVHGYLLDTSITALGYDLVTSASESFELVNEQGTKDSAVLGVVNGQNTRIESPASIQRLTDEFLDNVDVETVYISSNTELFYLPVNRFIEKLDVLGTAARTEAIA